MSTTQVKSYNTDNQADVNSSHELLVHDSDASGNISSSIATVTNVASSATSVQLLASNTSRKGAIFFNNSTQICYLKFGTSASSSSFTFSMAPQSTIILDEWPIYTGVIDSAWVSANGSMQITELT